MFLKRFLIPQPAGFRQTKNVSEAAEAEAEGNRQAPERGIAIFCFLDVFILEWGLVGLFFF